MKVAIVGCGGIGMAHARAYQQIPEAELVCVVDKNLPLAERRAAEIGCQALGDIGEIPDDVECVSVVTPPSTHQAIVQCLFEKGHHVFCEKPITMDIDQARDLIRIAQVQDRRLGVGFKMRHEPIFVKAKELVPNVGPIHLIATFKQQPYRPREGWDWVPEVGAMYELSVHDFDLVHSICGVVPRRICAARLDYSYGWPRENAFAITVEYDNGAVGSLSGMYAREGEWTGRDFALTVLGEKGYMQVERNDRIILHTDRVQVIEKPKEAPNTFAIELAEFISAVRTGYAPPIDGAAGYYTTAMVELAVKAAKEGASQDIAPSPATA
ncbi:MAG: Gfo/Idh/MocA family oxidoreductase [Planctomycetes bacterium]|nr:Gfo/Idh/MocA family oxidoreductase [Planctomycetota bacterium]